MDEAKRKYLEDLRRQIDPEVLRKMAEHLGAGGDEDAAAFSALQGGGRAASAPSDEGGGRRDIFGLFVARRIEFGKGAPWHFSAGWPSAKPRIKGFIEKKEEPRRSLLIYSHKEFWSRIAESQFKNLGFTEVQSFYDFESLVRGLFDGMGQSDVPVYLAVSIIRAVSFLKGWNRLKEQMDAQDKSDILEPVEYMLVVESAKQVPDGLITLGWQ